ncbi:spore germination protein (amino acid permease) [Orenia metallireducens]|uniref:Spore germination protein (Amino acid permease) n=2 Tax=Orenia metallireducens TaxID=1413210 RepID=A0A285G0D4_9FIRM|nr:spore germination protein (amino acid permease) [Orenia metallireducens]SNY16975.1 spore germination protein (amino acid permease) [Orenia metallireducens]
MSTKKISNKQAFLLSLNVILTTIILLVPSEMIMSAGRAAWISIIFASLLILAIHYIVFKLSCQFSNQSLVQDCIDIFGKILGRLILIPFIMLNIELTILIIYESVGFVEFVMPTKGAMGIWIANALIAGYLSYKGIETIMRVNGFGIFIMLFSIFIIISTNYDLIDFARLQPIVLDFKQIARGSLLPLHWFLIIPNLFLVYKPFFKDKAKVLKISLLGNLTSMVIISVLLATTITIFGSQLGSIIEYPFYTLSTLSITGLDVTVFVAWIMATMIKVGFYYFTSLYLIKEWFKLSSYRSLILPFMIFTVSLGYFQTDIHYLKTLFIYIITIFIFVLEVPFLLLLIGAYLFKNNVKFNP